MVRTTPRHTHLGLAAGRARPLVADLLLVDRHIVRLHGRQCPGRRLPPLPCQPDHSGDALPICIHVHIHPATIRKNAHVRVRPRWAEIVVCASPVPHMGVLSHRSQDGPMFTPSREESGPFLQKRPGSAAPRAPFDAGGSIDDTPAHFRQRDHLPSPPPRSHTPHDAHTPYTKNQPLKRPLGRECPRGEALKHTQEGPTAVKPI